MFVGKANVHVCSNIKCHWRAPLQGQRPLSVAEVWDEDQQGVENRGKREIKAAAVEGAGQPHLHAKSLCKEIVAAVGRASWADLSPLSIKGPTQDRGPLGFIRPCPHF